MQTASEPLIASPVRRNHFRFALTFVIVVGIANLLALGVAWQDRSWGALAIAVIYGPILNGIFALIGLLATAFLRRNDQFSIWRHVVLSLGVPIAAASIDAFIIFSMGLHGC